MVLYQKNKNLLIFFILIFTVFCTSGCAGDKYGKNSLSSNLLGSYTANIDFTISNAENNISGKADISKSETTTLIITSPENLSDISITSDNTGKDDILSLEFSGIPASIPKSSASNLSLLFSLFSNDVPSKILSLEETSFTDTLAEITKLNFTENGIHYNIEYDKTTGIPHLLGAGNDEVSVSVTITNFTSKKEQQQGKD